MSLIKFPGLIDVHVHLRDPGETNKEDYKSGTRAAVKGGFTYVLDMPNNKPYPIVSFERLLEKIQLAKEKTVCNIGFHYGTDGNNLNSFPKAYSCPKIFGLKVYCGKTTGELLIDNPSVLDRIFKAWDSIKPILLHAEGDILHYCLELARTYNRHVHVCHVASISDLTTIQHSKESQKNVYCGVTPSHLYLTDQDAEKLSPLGSVRPPIGNKETQDALWDAIKIGLIDLIESDHAPHRKEDKRSNNHAYGFPGLETTLGLLCRSLHEKKITLSDIQKWLYENPKRIFQIPDQDHTYIEFDPDKSFIAGQNGYETKCGWSPFDGWELFGKVETVVLRNRIFVSGRIFV